MFSGPLYSGHKFDEAVAYAREVASCRSDDRILVLDLLVLQVAMGEEHLEHDGTNVRGTRSQISDPHEQRSQRARRSRKRENGSR